MLERAKEGRNDTVGLGGVWVCREGLKGTGVKMDRIDKRRAKLGRNEKEKTDGKDTVSLRSVYVRMFVGVRAE